MPAPTDEPLQVKIVLYFENIKTVKPHLVIHATATDNIKHWQCFHDYGVSVCIVALAQVYCLYNYTFIYILPTWHHLRPFQLTQCLPHLAMGPSL